MLGNAREAPSAGAEGASSREGEVRGYSPRLGRQTTSALACCTSWYGTRSRR